MAKRIRQRRQAGAVGKAPMLLLFAALMLSCERKQAPRMPPDNPPRPHAAVITHPGPQSAVYSYTGRPASLYRPEAPIPVRRVKVHT